MNLVINLMEGSPKLKQPSKESPPSVLELQRDTGTADPNDLLASQ